MKKLISCEYNFDNCCVELKFTDGSMIAIDTIAVENEVADNLSHGRQALFGGSRTGGFCVLKATKDKEFAMSKIRLFVCSWHRNPCRPHSRAAPESRGQGWWSHPHRGWRSPQSISTSLEGNVINLSTQLLRAFYVFGKFG